MDLLRTDSEVTGVSSDLVQRYQPVVNVKGGIFDAFSHHRRAELLELRGDMKGPAARLSSSPEMLSVRTS